MKFYALFANDILYDDSDKLETVQGWFDKFGAALKNNEIPHRWFHKFLDADGKMARVYMELREFEYTDGRVLKKGKF